jgi:hypothetical protein
VPRAVEPEPQLLFEEFAVARLARPEPFRESACMPAGVSGWRRWMRQVLPRRGGTRTCCWYHGGDWHTQRDGAADPPAGAGAVRGRRRMGSPRSWLAGTFYEVLEQILAQHPPEAPGRPEEDASAG